MLRSVSLGATVEVAVMWEWEKQDNSYRCKFKGVFKSVLSTEKAKAPHSSALAWKVPWTEEPGRLQSMGSLRVGHD